MHSYSIDSEERKYVYLLLALASVVLSWGLNKALVANHFDMPWWGESPSVMLIYGLIFFVFDRWAWKVLKKIGITKTPNLNGLWKGQLRSSFDKHITEMEATLSIFQRWTRIKILLITDQSSSKSESASMIVCEPEGSYLSYQYINEPKSGSVKNMSIHRGTVRIFYKEKEDTLIGEYYSGRDRQQYGNIELKRISNNH